MPDPYTTKPNDQLDLERRQAEERGEAGPEVGEARSFALEGNDTSGYLGVCPEYQNYANPGDAPLKAEDGPTVPLEQQAYEFEASSKTGEVTESPEPAPEPTPEPAPEPTPPPNTPVTAAGGQTPSAESNQGGSAGTQ